MTQPVPTQLAVLGAPISHSRSPLLHDAAYAALNLNWHYSAIEVAESGLAEFMSSRGSEWRGLSLTMPLKRAVVELLDHSDPLVVVTGTANTVVFERETGDSSGASLHGYNTDVFGIVESFASRGLTALPLVYVLGGGATASSAIAAAAQLGARRVVVWARSPQRAHSLGGVGQSVGVDVELAPLGAVTVSETTPSAIISTLPQGVDAALTFRDEVKAEAVLFDVAYEPWPSPLARTWLAAGGNVIPGIDMLVNQALMQVRLFVSGSAQLPLHDESEVLARMRAAVGL